MARYPKQRITVSDLKDQTGAGPRPFLKCFVCGAEASANKGDYFWMPEDKVFRCCRRNMALVTEHVSYQVVSNA